MKGLLKRLAIVIVITFLVVLILFQLSFEISGDSQAYIVLLLSFAFMGGLFWAGLGYKTTKVNYQANILQENISTEFETLYKELCNNNIQQLEKMRKQVKWRTILSIICVLIAMTIR